MSYSERRKATTPYVVYNTLTNFKSTSDKVLIEHHSVTPPMADSGWLM